MEDVSEGGLKRKADAIAIDEESKVDVGSDLPPNVEEHLTKRAKVDELTNDEIAEQIRNLDIGEVREGFLEILATYDNISPEEFLSILKLVSPEFLTSVCEYCSLNTPEALGETEAEDLKDLEDEIAANAAAAAAADGAAASGGAPPAGGEAGANPSETAPVTVADGGGDAPTTNGVGSAAPNDVPEYKTHDDLRGADFETLREACVTIFSDSFAVDQINHDEIISMIEASGIAQEIWKRLTFTGPYESEFMEGEEDISDEEEDDDDDYEDEDFLADEENALAEEENAEALEAEDEAGEEDADIIDGSGE